MCLSVNCVWGDDFEFFWWYLLGFGCGEVYGGEVLEFNVCVVYGEVCVVGDVEFVGVGCVVGVE